ncbi:hypothetical protein Tco_0462745 [Tanacetum coccineum]
MWGWGLVIVMVLDGCGRSTKLRGTGLGFRNFGGKGSVGEVQCFKTRGEIDPNDKGKKRVEEDEESDTKSEEIIEAKKKFDQIAHDEEVARKMQDEWEAEEERKRLTEEEATKTALSNEYDFI